MYRIPKEAFAGIPTELMRLHQFMVIDRIGKTLLVAVAGVLNTEVLDKLEKITGCQVFVYVSTGSQVQMALDKNMPVNGQAAAAKPGAGKQPPPRPPAPPAPGRK
jgi:CO dehydrogenase/acetyl-CoA synthase epsilon subunit